MIKIRYKGILYRLKYVDFARFSSCLMKKNGKIDIFIDKKLPENKRSKELHLILRGKRKINTYSYYSKTQTLAILKQGKNIINLY
jgi:hypothetical protein